MRQSRANRYLFGMGTERLDPSRTALIAYDVCKRILTPKDPAARERMRPALESWAVLINGCRELGIPIIYTTPVSRAAAS